MSTSSGETLRLGGLMSGMPTDDIIKQLLAVDQSKIDKLDEEKQTAQAKIEQWKNVAQELKSFGGNVQKLMGDTGNLYSLKSADSSSSTTVGATASASARNGTHVVSVTALARANVAYGSQKATNYTLPSAGSVILNGTTINFAGGETLSQIAAAINGAAYGTGKGMIATIIDDRLTLRTADTGASATIHGTTAGSPPFNVGTDDPDSILSTELGIIDVGGDLVNEAQTSQDAAFTVDGISLSRSTNTVTDAIEGVSLELLDITSSDVKLTIANDTQEIKETLVDFIDFYNSLRSQIEAIRNAKLEDEDYGMFFSDPLMREIFNEVRNLSTAGIRMGDDNWNGSLTASGAASVGATQLTISNFDAATGTLSKGDQFVIAGDTTIYRLVNDASISGNSATIDIYPPLEIATSGGESIKVAIRSLETIGIGIRKDTGSGLGVEGVMGILDEGALDNILASDVELIKRIMGRVGDSTNQQGSARRLYNWIDTKTKVSAFASKIRAIDDTTIDNLEDKIDNLEEQIQRLEARMAKREQTLVLQFARMEEAMAKAQSATGALSGLTGGQSAAQS